MGRGPLTHGYVDSPTANCSDLAVPPKRLRLTNFGPFPSSIQRRGHVTLRREKRTHDGFKHLGGASHCHPQVADKGYSVSFVGNTAASQGRFRSTGHGKRRSFNGFRVVAPGRPAHGRPGTPPDGRAGHPKHGQFVGGFPGSPPAAPGPQAPARFPVPSPKGASLSAPVLRPGARLSPSVAHQPSLPVQPAKAAHDGARAQPCLRAWRPWLPPLPQPATSQR